MIKLIILSISLGFGLAMDAFSVSLANGLNEPDMKRSKMLGVSGMFAFFQFAMPFIGWGCVVGVATAFKVFEKFIPYIALVLLCYIGGKMLMEGIKCDISGEQKPPVGFMGLVVQGIATSIDALSVGFTIAHYNFFEALLSSVIIGIVTYATCFIGVAIGKKAGLKLSCYAGIVGGAILIFIGLEIFITSFF